MNTDRRKRPSQPRDQTLLPASARLGVTELAYAHGLKYPYLLGHGWEVLDRDGDHVLMRAPADWPSESPTLSRAYA